jgi:hypothetical protein
MNDPTDDITVTRVESHLINDEEDEQLFVKLNKANGFSKGDTVIILHYKDLSNVMDVSTVSELRRKLESYANSFKRVKELIMKLESTELYYKEQLSEVKDQYNDKISRLKNRLS